MTSVTKRLLDYWRDPEEFDNRRFFFLPTGGGWKPSFWLREAAESERVGIRYTLAMEEISQRLCAQDGHRDGQDRRHGDGHRLAHPEQGQLSPRHPLPPGMCWWSPPASRSESRLAVLEPSPCRRELLQGVRHSAHRPCWIRLRTRGEVRVRNWHALNWENEEQVARKRSVDKRGAKSDEAYVRDVLGEMATAHNLLVINDEAHHAWRVPAESKVKGVARADIEEATKWVGGLDRIHRARGILTCYDYSATPFAPSGKRSSEEALFDWIVSDFGLNDAIESGLVKTPRVVVRDDALPDAKTYKSRLYHIYNDPDVKDDLNRRAKPEEPLPDLVANGYYLLGYDWRETAKSWENTGFKTPPVMITVANRTETAARVKHAFDRKRILIDELCDQERTLHIDSGVLKRAEESEEPIAEVLIDDEDNSNNGVVSPRLTADQRAEQLRRMVDTVGRLGQPGGQIQNVISVGMLSEGWDAKTVTHIMGLRAFSSQLLCEQVVGRGLRRTAYELDDYTGMFEPEYVNIFGVPFTFLPHESEEGVAPKPATRLRRPSSRLRKRPPSRSSGPTSFASSTSTAHGCPSIGIERNLWISMPARRRRLPSLPRS